MQISIIGGGTWGTALAQVLANNGHKVTMLVRDKNTAEDISTKHINTKYFPSLILSENIFATTNKEEALYNKDLYIYASAFQHAEAILHSLLPFFPKNIFLLNVSKGIREKDALTMSAIAENVFYSHALTYAVLSGPSFAHEVASGKMTAVSIASKNIKDATALKNIFSSSYFKAKTMQDVIGVEIAGAAKNVIAIASGMFDSLNYGSNANAFLITKGLAEITRIGFSLGASADTFTSFAGIGDLLLTSMGPSSRNRFVGSELAKGKKLQEIMDSMHTIAEGIPTCFALYALAKEKNISMPITESVFNILEGTISLEEARERIFNI